MVKLEGSPVFRFLAARRIADGGRPDSTGFALSYPIEGGEAKRFGRKPVTRPFLHLSAGRAAGNGSPQAFFAAEPLRISQLLEPRKQSATTRRFAVLRADLIDRKVQMATLGTAVNSLRLGGGGTYQRLALSLKSRRIRPILQRGRGRS